jgi:sugar phosphate isomerase/epimerase
MSRPCLACQLYTVRALTHADFPGTIRSLAEIGYRAVELAGYGSAGSAVEARKVLDDHGMAVVGSHANLEALEKHLPRLIEDSHTLGNRTIVLSFLPEPRRKDSAGWRAAAKALERIGADCHDCGLELAYHHHHFEFQKFDGQCGLDILWQNADARFVKAELDTFWIKYGGQDPAGYITRLGSRTPLVHLKDMQAGPERRFGEVGTGTLDFPSILTAMEKAGVRCGIVEQDVTYDRPPLESLRISFENLRRLGAA